MFYIYILKSKQVASAVYVGFTTDLKSRLSRHNAGEVASTKRYTPWEVESYFAFRTEFDAKRFEEYLKSGSGRAFLRKRLISGQFKKALAKSHADT